MLRSLSESDCLICSSYHETFGVGLIEAAFYGLKIISSKCEGPSDIVNKSNGILVKKNSVKYFEEAMLKIINFNESYNSFNIKKDIVSRYGNKSFLKKYNKIIKKIFND